MSLPQSCMSRLKDQLAGSSMAIEHSQPYKLRLRASWEKISRQSGLGEQVRSAGKVLSADRFGAPHALGRQQQLVLRRAVVAQS